MTNERINEITLEKIIELLRQIESNGEKEIKAELDLIEKINGFSGHIKTLKLGKISASELRKRFNEYMGAEKPYKDEQNTTATVRGVNGVKPNPYYRNIRGK